MAELQVLDPVLLHLPPSFDAASSQADKELEGVVAVIDSTAKRIGVRLTGSSVGKGNCSGKMGDLQCPQNGGIYVDMPDTMTTPSERVIRKRPVTRLDELRLRRELGISSSSTTSVAASGARSRGANTTINRSRIRRRQDADAAGGLGTSQRVASTSSNPADPPETFRLPTPSETGSSLDDRNKAERESDRKPESRAGPSLNDAASPPSLQQLQKELAELPQQVKSTQERLEQVKIQKEQRFQQQQQQMYKAATQRQEKPESPQEKPENEPVVERTIFRRSDPPGRSSDAESIERLRAWSQETIETRNGQAEVTETVNAEAENSGSAATGATEANSDASSSAENIMIGRSTQASRTEAISDLSSSIPMANEADTEDFMIGQSAKTPRVEAITDLSSSLPMSPLEKVEAKNNPDLASRMNVSNCSSIGQEVSEVSFFLTSNAHLVHQGLNEEDKPINLSTQMEASNSSAEKSDSNVNTTQQSSEGMEQVLDPWDRILLQSKGIMELDKPETVLHAAVPQPVSSIVDPWAPKTNGPMQTTTFSNPYIGMAPVPLEAPNTSGQSTSLDVSNPYGAMAPVPIPLPAPSPERSSIKDDSSMAPPTPLRSNTRTKNAERATTKPAQERALEESSDSQMGEMMKYILASRAAEEPLQNSTNSFNSLDKKPPNSPYAKAASEARPLHTTESTFSNLKTSEGNVGESSENMGVMMRYILEPQQANLARDEEESQKSGASSFTSMDNKSTNRKYAKAASKALPTDTTETTFADLLRKAEKRGGRKTPKGKIQSKPSFDDGASMVSVGLESTKSVGLESTKTSGLESTKNVQFDEKKEDESHASSSQTPFSELKPLSINSERRSFGSSKPWSKVLNRLTDDVPEPDFRRPKSEPRTPTRTELASIGTFSEKSESPARSQDSYSTSSLPKPPGLRTQFDEDHDLFPLDETGVSLGQSPIKGLEFNALMPLMTALNENSIRPARGESNDVTPPNFDENSFMDKSISTNAAVQTTPNRSLTKNQSASPLGNPFGSGAYTTPPRTPAAVTPAKPPRKIETSSDSPLETSSITNEAVTTPSRPTNAFGSPVRSPLENSVFTNGPVTTPTRANNVQKPPNATQNVFRGKSGQENRPRLNSSDETGSLLNTTANSLYSDGADEKDAESFSSYAWTAQPSVSGSKSGDNDVFLAGTFDVESQASTPSKIPRITLDDSFSLYSHMTEQQQENTPKFLQLDMKGQIKEIIKNTKQKREQTRNETTKIVKISPLKSPDEDYESDKQSFVSSSSSEESESLKESSAEDEFFSEPPKRKGPNRQQVIRCLAIFVAMVFGAAAAVLYGLGILDLETGESQRVTPVEPDGGSSVPTVELLADKLGIEEFDLVLAHIQASLEWVVNNDSSEFINSLEQWQLGERFALIALYIATSSTELGEESDWKQKRGFLTPDVSVCQWNVGGHGVFCDDQGQVVEVNLDANDMAGVLPKELGRLSMMESLSLASNRITGSLPASLFELQHLYALVLSDNKLTGDIPESRNGALQILNLSHNYKLTGKIPESLTQQTSLKHLALKGTNIGGTIPEFSSDSDLEFVAIADSRVDGSIPSSLTTLSNLRYLYLIENALSGTVPKEYKSENVFKSGNSIQHLYLSGNRLSGKIPSELKSLTRLQHLGLDFNSLNGALPTELARIDSLEYLYLNSNVNLDGDLADFELQPLVERLKELQIQNTSTLSTEDSLCKSGTTSYEWDFVSSDCKAPSNRIICSCCDVCCPNDEPDSDNVCLSFNPSGKSILENTVW